MVIKDREEEIKRQEEESKKQEKERQNFEDFKKNFDFLLGMKIINKNFKVLIEKTEEEGIDTSMRFFTFKGKCEGVSAEPLFYGILPFVPSEIFSIKNELINNFVIDNCDKMTYTISKLFFKDFVFNKQRAEEYKRLKEKRDNEKKQKIKKLGQTIKQLEEDKKKAKEESKIFTDSISKYSKMVAKYIEDKDKAKAKAKNYKLVQF